MAEFPDTELSRRLRANWGRRMLPDFTMRVERGLLYTPQAVDFVDLPATDRLGKAFLERLQEIEPSKTWPESQRERVFDHLRSIAEASPRSTRPTSRTSAGGNTSASCG
jgi:hypothetical protein